MSNRINPDVHLDHTHAQAVCHGVGERLRDAMERSRTDAPQTLRDLYDRLPELDAERAPSIVPSSHEAF